MSKKPGRLSFSPALPCVDCPELAIQGVIYPMSPQVWQLLPLYRKDIEEPEPGSEEDTFATTGHLQRLMTNRIRVIEQLQHKRRQIARVYVRLRRQHAHVKAQRALRRQLRSICQREAEEVWHDA